MEKRYKFGDYVMWVLLPIIFGLCMLIFLAVHEGKFSPHSSAGVNAKATSYIQPVSTTENV